MPDRTMHMIGNAHLDPVWLWRWQEGFAENRATMRSMLDRLDENDEVIFTSSSAQFYEWIELNDREMFEEIRLRIGAGRWVLCGGWWVQPDCNIPSGESFARHSLIAQNYFHEKFGVVCSVGYCVDSFGHHGMLPQILKKSRMDSYVFMRPNRKEKGIRDNLFRWESPDGSSVLAFRIPYSYCAYEGLEEQIRASMREFNEGFDEIMCFYGVGNHGGGPTRENIATIENARAESRDCRLVFSDPEKFFRRVRTADPPLETVRGDLQHHASGCYSVHSGVKKQNRKSENALLSAEKYCVLSGILTGKDYGRELDESWKRVLFNQFHDILAGTCIEEAYRDSEYSYGEARSAASRAENSALQAISSRVGIPAKEGSVPVVVFNPHSWPIDAYVEMETGTFRNTQMPEPFAVKDYRGRIVPHQILEPVVRERRRIRLVFAARVPAMGYSLYTIEEADRSIRTEPLHTAEYVLENRHLRIRFDPETGAIESMYDKESSIEFISGESISGEFISAPSAVGTVLNDRSDTWSHGVTRYDEIAGRFGVSRMEKIADGPVLSSMKVASRYGDSTMEQIFTLHAESRQLDVAVKLNWQGKFSVVKLYFSTGIERGIATYEIPFGSIGKEADGEEEPMQNWVDLSGTGAGNEHGLSVINDCKYSADVLRDRIGLTVLRSPTYSRHRPFREEVEENEFTIMDRGFQEFAYSLIPHTGRWKSKVTRAACQLNQPHACIVESFHGGVLPPENEGISLDRENIVMSAFKRKHDRLRDGEYVLRLYETEGLDTDVTIRFSSMELGFSAFFRPYEIKSFAIDRDSASVKEVDFLEWSV